MYFFLSCAVPGVVTDVRVYAVSATEVCVSWVPPRGADCVTRYEVQLAMVEECHTTWRTSPRPPPPPPAGTTKPQAVQVCPPIPPPTKPAGTAVSQDWGCPIESRYSSIFEHDLSNVPNIRQYPNTTYRIFKIFGSNSTCRPVRTLLIHGSNIRNR